MNRKLIALNIVLLLVAVYAGVLFHNQWTAGKTREAALWKAKPKPAPVNPLEPLPGAGAVLASGYAEVAKKNLFHPSRDPNIPIELPPPPPPPPPMPMLPKYYGTMNIGDGPMALLSVSAGVPAQAIKPGEQVGAFKLVDINTVDITFEWDGKIVRRTLDQVTDRTIQAAAPAASSDGRSVQAAAPVAAPVVKSALGPGPMTGQGFATCQANDNMPYGSVQNGLKKVELQTPFGPACRWEPLGR